MSKPRGRSFDDIRPEDLKVLKDVRVKTIYFPEGPKSHIPYFEVVHEGETLRIRFQNEDVKEWVEAHQDVALDLTIFPYKWEVGLDDPQKYRSGVVNYFRHAKVRES